MENTFFVVNADTYIVNEWTDTEQHRKWAESGTMGVILYEGEVETGYDGLLYAKGNAPVESQEQKDAKRISEIDARLAELDAKSIRPSRNLAAGVNESSLVGDVTVTDEDALRTIREEVSVLRAERATLLPQK